MKARALKEVWNVAAVVPVEKGGVAGHGHDHHHHRRQEQEQADDKDQFSSGELLPEDNFLGLCTQELLARGTELLKRTRKGRFFFFFLATLELRALLQDLGNGFNGEVSSSCCRCPALEDRLCLHQQDRPGLFCTPATSRSSGFSRSSEDGIQFNSSVCIGRSCSR